MAFLPKPREKIENAESDSDLYQLSGSDDDSLIDDWSDPGPLFEKLIFQIRYVTSCSRSLPPKKRIL